MAAVCSWDSSGTSGVDCVLEDVSKTMLFLLPSVCGGCVCSGNSSGTSGVDCVGGSFKNYAVFCSLLCVAAVGVVGFLVELVAWNLCWRMFLILC